MIFLRKVTADRWLNGSGYPCLVATDAESDAALRGLQCGQVVAVESSVMTVSASGTGMGSIKGNE